MAHQIIKYIFILFFLNLSFVKAQDDLLQMLTQEQPKKKTPVYATFKATRVITGQSNEQVAAKHLNFVILHRFGSVNNGISDLFGLDIANIRFVFDYGLNDNIQLGFGRSSIRKTYDGNIKIKLLKQQKNGMPFSLSYYGNVAINTTPWENPNRNNLFTSRLSYLNQLIFSKKINDNFSILLAPTMVHENLVAKTNDLNTTASMGFGSSIKLTRSARFNIEYYPRITGLNNSTPPGIKHHNYLALGFDIETGGHVFQLMFTNGSGMLEQQMIRQTQTSWSDMGIRLGFNISRTFSFDKQQTKNW
ncbi:MAG: DUF5777 family beta-barrel protein [Bacteroidia bacterium]